MNKSLILVVEDDTSVRNLITTTLKAHEYRYLTAPNGQSAILEASSHNPDIVLLDLGLPDMDGVEIIKKIRTWSNMPIIVISARSEDTDKIDALDAGADDYLTKPCNMERLLARIKNLLRRTEEQVGQGLLNVQGFLLDPNTFTLYIGKTSYILPKNEGKILLTLLKNAPNIVTKEELYNILWGTDEFIDDNALQVNLVRLRKTLARFGLEQRIETVRGQGYRMKG